MNILAAGLAVSTYGGMIQSNPFIYQITFKPQIFLSIASFHLQAAFIVINNIHQ
jgi:hypothetical protein